MSDKSILVLLNGRSGVGKDTFIRLCLQHLSNKHHVSAINLHRSDIPKEAMRELGWDNTKDQEARSLLAHMVNYMENKGLMDKYLETFIPHKGFRVVFWQVREPRKMYSLLRKYIHSDDVLPISVLIKRDVPDREYDNWGIESADYMLKIKLPLDDMEMTSNIAREFSDLLISENYELLENSTMEEQKDE